jgi:hypothetical protein
MATKITKKVGGKLEQTADAKLAHKKRTAKLKEKMGIKMGITTEPADSYDPFAKGQVGRQTEAEQDQPSTDDTGATKTADIVEATAACREANKHEWRLQLNMFGDLTWMDGRVIFADETCGQFLRNYFTEKVIHRVFSKGSGYSVEVTARGCLDY